MATRGNGISQVFRALADILEPLETAGHEITSAEPVEEELVDAEAVSMHVGVQLPFLDQIPGTSTTALTPTDVHLQDDGTLRVDLQATVTPQETTGDSHQKDQTVQDSEGDDELPKSAPTSARDPDEREQSDSSTTTEDTTHQSENTEPAGSETREAAESSKETSGDGPSQAHDEATSTTSDDSVPAYQDPAQLQAVYNAHETFAEMTEALDVEVTPQTVRRYMIQHGIHEPASNTGSWPAETLLEMDPDALLNDTDQSPTGTGLLGTTRSASSAVDYDKSQDEGPADDDCALKDDTLKAEQVATSDADVAAGTARETEDHEPRPADTANEEVPRGESSEVATGGAAPRDPTVSARTGAGLTVDEEVIAAAVDLPAHLTLDEVKDAVRHAKTLYEVQNQLEVDPDRARDLLQDLNLLELVYSRLATRTRENRTTDEIDRRIIRQFAAHPDGATEATPNTLGGQR
jgi:hypothetical protein